MFNRTKKQKTKPGPKTSLTKDGHRLVAIIPPSLVREIEKAAIIRKTSRRVVVQEALMEYFLPPSLVSEVEKIAIARHTNRRVIVQEALTEYVRKYRNGPESEN